MKRSEIIIVGAGPVGLSLAVDCARRGLDFRIVDASPHPSDKSKALAIWSAAQELFSAMGVLDTMMAEGMQPEGIRICSRKKTLLRIPSGEYVDSPFPRVLLLPQSSTERILLERLSELGHKVERPVEFVSLDQDASGVTVKLQNPDGTEEDASCEFLVGCDGAHSAVRHAVGGKFLGKALPTCFVLCDAEVSGPLPPEVQIFVSRHGILPLFPIHGKVWRIISTRSANDGTSDPTLEEMQEHLDRRGPGGLTLSNPEWLSCFRISERKVDRFRRGRVLLAGDAAHIHSPAGGQGMNTGVQDAWNLGWKLETILRHAGNTERLLESYHEERSPVASHVVADASLRTRLATIARGPLAGLRNLAALMAGHSKLAVEKLAVSFSGIGIRYLHSPILLPDKHWQEDWLPHGIGPGLRLRDARVYSDELSVSLLQEVLGQDKHTLLIFSGRKPIYRDADLIEALRHNAAGYSSLVRSLCVWQGSHVPDASWMLDPDGSAHRRFGAELPSAYLVRPDGVVAARVQPADFAPIAEALALLR